MPQTKYTKDHEYIRIENGVGTVGITAFAQEKLGDVTFIEMPAIGKTLAIGDASGVVESVKAASDIYAPVSGEVVEINTALTQNPELVNQDPEGSAWFFKVKLSAEAELDGLMDKNAYTAFAREQG